MASQDFREFNWRMDQLLTRPVKLIIAINVAVTIFVILAWAVNEQIIVKFLDLFAQDPQYSIKHFYIWQFLSYMFVHVDFGHLLMNMLGVGFFGRGLVHRWGEKKFWEFYLTVGIGAGLIHAIVALTTGIEGNARIIGASGAVYGILLAYACYWPDATVFIYFLFPVKIKYLMIAMILFVFLSTSTGSGHGISNLTHLSGLCLAYVWLAWRHGTWSWRRWRQL